MEKSQKMDKRLEAIKEINERGYLYKQVETISQKLKLNSSSIKNLYLIGSRLWGTANDKSDWDVMIVLDSDKASKSSMHNSEIDATVYSQKEFLERLNKHEFLCVIAINLPEDWKWKEQIEFKKNFVLNKKILSASVIEEADRDWKIARKKIEKKQLDAGKKVFFFT